MARLTTAPRFLRVREVLEMTVMSLHSSIPRWQRAPSPSRSTWVLAPSSRTSARWSSGWKTAWHPDNPDGWGPKYQQNSPKAGHSRVPCLFLWLPEIVRDLKSSRAFPFVGWTRPHQRHSLCCGISDTIWEILPMLCHAVLFRSKSTSTLSVQSTSAIGRRSP